METRDTMQALAYGDEVNDDMKLHEESRYDQTIGQNMKQKFK